MEGSVGRGEPGGIYRLLGLIHQYREAVRYDLFRVGRSLDALGRDYSWNDFAVFVKYSPPGSRLATEVNGPAWGTTDLLLAAGVNAQMARNYQAGGNKGPKPKWIVPPQSKPVGDKENFGKPIPIDQMRDALLYRNGRAPEVSHG